MTFNRNTHRMALAALCLMVLTSACATAPVESESGYGNEPPATKVPMQD